MSHALAAVPSWCSDQAGFGREITAAVWWCVPCLDLAAHVEL